MAVNKSIIVLTPNGRRQNVEVTPNTTILQILEEVCKKHGYDANDYDIKHFNKILDVNSILRFTGLSNNARVEMVPCKKPRNASKVTVGILFENGERLMDDFLPDVTLAHVLTTICPNEDRKTTVIIYMHRKVHGEALEETTLKSLGLTSGKAMLRMMHRDLEQLQTQAHVSQTLLPKSSKNLDNNDANDIDTKYDKQKISSTSKEGKALDPITLLKEERNKMKLQDSIHIGNITTMDKGLDNKDRDNAINTSTYRKELLNYNDVKDELNANLHSDAEEEINIEFLGERNALVFNQAEVQAFPKNELPDSFFNLTVEDAKILLRDAKRKREELEEAPLLIEAQRKLEEDKRVLAQLNKYRKVVIRVQFPNQLVLQGWFRPVETVQTIKDFIKNYLEDPTCDFTIYTAPPKHILKSEARLIDENLVPCAIVYYSGSSSLAPFCKSGGTFVGDCNCKCISRRMGPPIMFPVGPEPPDSPWILSIKFVSTKSVRLLSICSSSFTNSACNCESNNLIYLSISPPLSSSSPPNEPSELPSNSPSPPGTTKSKISRKVLSNTSASNSILPLSSASCFALSSAD